MQAPPLEPPVTFAIDNGKVLKSALTSGIFWLLLEIWNTYDLVLHIKNGKSYTFDLILFLFAGFWLLVTVFQGYMNYGAVIELRDGKLRRVGPGGKVHVQGPVAGIAALKVMHNISQSKPSHYMVEWSPKAKLMFDARFQNVETLMMLLEQRTGKQFILQRS